LRKQLEGLVALQIVDLKIEEMERVKDEIPQHIASLEEDFRKEEEKVISQRSELEKFQKERRRKEKELEEEIERVKKAEARVFEIKTNKEYQAVQKELENAKKLNKQREEEILEILERLEEMEKHLQKAEKALEVRRKECQRQISDLQQKAASFDQEMASQVQRREERRKEISPDLLSKYCRLREKRQGVAVAQVMNGVCHACYMNLRPQLYIELQKQETLIFCPNCNRILFWENGLAKAKET